MRDNSRVKLKLADIKQPIDTILLALAVDHLSFIAWSKTKDAQKGQKRPPSVLKKILGEEYDEKVVSFDTGEDFSRAWESMIRG